MYPMKAGDSFYIVGDILARHNKLSSVPLLRRISSDFGFYISCQGFGQFANVDGCLFHLYMLSHLSLVTIESHYSHRHIMP